MKQYNTTLDLHGIIRYIGHDAMIAPEIDSSEKLINLGKLAVQYFPTLYCYNDVKGNIHIVNTLGVMNLINYFNNASVVERRQLNRIKIVLNIAEDFEGEELENYINIVNS